MYQIDVITLFPGMFTSVLEHGVVGRAVSDGLIEFRSWNPRDFTQDKHRTVDDRPYGGGPGMVMMYEPVCSAITRAREAQPDSKVIYLSPQGRRLDQDGVHDLAQRSGLILVSGRYEGIDERIVEAEVDEEWSIGDYVLSGGELAAMVMIDTVCRTLPGVLGHEDSANEDSFVDGLLDYPHYTRPEQVDGYKVPEVLLGGNHEEIRRWRLKQALGKTWQVRPDLIEAVELNKSRKNCCRNLLPSLSNKRELNLYIDWSTKMANIIEQLEAEQMSKEVPEFAPGDTVVVQVKVKEGQRERLQAFEGVVIAVKNRGLNSSFTVRKISYGEGVERVFQTYSPSVAEIQVKRKGDVRRAKLYYMRDRRGKSARIKEKIKTSS